MKISKLYGMAANIFRNAGFTSGGITSKYDRVVLVLSQAAIDLLTSKVVGTNNPSIDSWGMVKIDAQAGLEIDEFTHEPGCPVLRVDVRKDGRLIAVPIGADWDGRRLMSGGNFVFSGDGRFRALSAHPIPVHDRARKRA